MVWKLNYLALETKRLFLILHGQFNYIYSLLYSLTIILQITESFNSLTVSGS